MAKPGKALLFVPLATVFLATTQTAFTQETQTSNQQNQLPKPRELKSLDFSKSPKQLQKALKNETLNAYGLIASDYSRDLPSSTVEIKVTKDSKTNLIDVQQITTAVINAGAQYVLRQTEGFSGITPADSSKPLVSRTPNNRKLEIEKRQMTQGGEENTDPRSGLYGFIYEFKTGPDGKESLTLTFKNLSDGAKETFDVTSDLLPSDVSQQALMISLTNKAIAEWKANKGVEKMISMAPIIQTKKLLEEAKAELLKQEVEKQRIIDSLKAHTPPPIDYDKLKNLTGNERDAYVDTLSQQILGRIHDYVEIDSTMDKAVKELQEKYKNSSDVTIIMDEPDISISPFNDGRLTINIARKVNIQTKEAAYTITDVTRMVSSTANRENYFGRSRIYNHTTGITENKGGNIQSVSSVYNWNNASLEIIRVDSAGAKGAKTTLPDQTGRNALDKQNELLKTMLSDPAGSMKLTDEQIRALKATSSLQKDYNSKSFTYGIVKDSNHPNVVFVTHWNFDI
jgi:hypothetical protein